MKIGLNLATPSPQMPTVPLSQAYNAQQNQQYPVQNQQLPGAYVPQMNPYVPYGMSAF